MSKLPCYRAQPGNTTGVYVAGTAGSDDCSGSVLLAPEIPQTPHLYPRVPAPGAQVQQRLTGHHQTLQKHLVRHRQAKLQ